GFGADVTESFHEIYLDINGAGTGKISIGDASALAATTSTTTNNDGNWHHVVGTYSGSGGTHTSTIYIDGVSKGTSATTLTVAGAPTQVRAFGLANDVSNTVPFAGNLDELRIYAV